MKAYKTIKALTGWVLLPAGLVLAAGMLVGCGDDRHHRMNYGRHDGYYPAPVVVHQPPPVAVYRSPVYREPGPVYRAPVVAPSYVAPPRHGGPVHGGPPDRGGPRHR